MAELSTSRPAPKSTWISNVRRNCITMMRKMRLNPKLLLRYSYWQSDFLQFSSLSENQLMDFWWESAIKIGICINTWNAFSIDQCSIHSKVKWKWNVRNVRIWLHYSSWSADGQSNKKIMPKKTIRKRNIDAMGNCDVCMCMDGLCTFVTCLSQPRKKKQQQQPLVGALEV